MTEKEILLGECRLEVANCVRARIHEHTMPPVGLGRRATATEYKVRAWLHALSLEHGSDEAMAGALGSFVSLTTDLGAESGIADYECLRWRDFLGPWQDEVRLEADEAPRGSAPLCRGAQPEALLPNGCVCPGVLHIIDNAFLDMDTQLPGWRGWYDGLTAILKVLSSDPLRQSFVHHCVCSGRRPDLEPKFQRTLPNLAHWRWGTLAKVLTDLLPLEGPFRATWSTKAFQFGARPDHDKQARPGGEELGQPAPVRGDRITEVAHDRAWWCYGDMLLALHSIGEEMKAWMEGCGCCPRGDELHRWRRILAVRAV